MTNLVTIGEFSTITRLSRKALRHYHELGLLAPARVDVTTGYRYYSADQIRTAQLIRRLRDLDMPVPELRAYLAADDDGVRDAVVAEHLQRMETQLAKTTEAITALRAILSAQNDRGIVVRHLEPISAVAIMAQVRLPDVVPWWQNSMDFLASQLRSAGVPPAGPPGSLFAHELFSDEFGEVTAWIPTPDRVQTADRIQTTVEADQLVISGGWFAVAVHDGPDSQLDQTYAALGEYVAGHRIGAAGPVREHYLAGGPGDPRPLVTEIAWPVVAPEHP
jgi:DNA-binding transcriptional MerR regulator/effector-binding domain-containing protein